MKSLLYLSLLLLLACCDRRTPKENELRQYPQLRIFMPGSNDFQGIEHNLDLGKYSFSFRTNYSPIDSFFKVVDKDAVNNEWKIIQKSANDRKYEKQSTIYNAAKGYDIVTLVFNPKNDRITCSYSVNKEN